MPDAAVLETLMVRLVGDVEGYMKSLNLAASRTKEAGDKIAEQTDKMKSVWNKVGEAIPGLVSKTQFYINAVKSGQDLIKGKFESTGEAMSKMGDMANLIPGPWGAAVSSILNILGSVIDWFEGPLRKNQEIARNAFTSMATGAKTFARAVDSINAGAMTEALEKMEKLVQFQHQMGDMGSEGATAGFQAVFGLENREKILEKMRAQIEARTRMLEVLRGDAQLRGLALDMLTGQAGTEALERSEQQPEMAQRRRTMRAMHDTHRSVESAAAQIRASNELLAVRRQLRALGIQDNAENITAARIRLNLDENFQQSQRNVIRNIREARAERMAEQVEEMGNKWSAAMTEANDKARVLVATQRGMLPLARQEMEVRMRDQREIDRLREQGFGAEVLRQRALQQEALRGQLMHNAVLTENNRLLVSTRNPVEVYRDEVARLGEVFSRTVNPNIEVFGRALLRAEDAFRRTDAGWQAFNQQAQAGISIAARFADPAENMIQQISELGVAYTSGRLSAVAYERALEGLAEQQERTNDAFRGTPAVAAGSAAALAMVEEQQRSLAGGGRMDRTDPGTLAAMARGASLTAGGVQVQPRTVEQGRLATGGGVAQEGPGMMELVRLFRQVAEDTRLMREQPRLEVIAAALGLGG